MRIAVLGSGVMGHGIAQVAAVAGHTVVLRDIERGVLDRAIEKIRWSLGKMVEKGKLQKADADAALARVTPEVCLREAVGGAEMIIEAVPEIMELKRKVYAELDEAVAGADPILASNTSTLPITEIASALARPERFIGVHFFNPPQLMKLVEVIPGEQTRKDVVGAVTEFVRSVGKEPVLCGRDVPGFIVNRLFIPAVHEACYMADRHGYTMEQIDSAVRFTLGFPMGIFELADFTGLDVIHKATQEMHSRDRGVVRPHARLAELFDAGRLGQKSGAGFYEYSKDKYERVKLDESLAAKCDALDLASNIANNAAWMVSNNVADIGTIELAARLGLGMKKTVSEIVRELGAARIEARLRELARAEDGFYAPDAAVASL